MSNDGAPGNDEARGDMRSRRALIAGAAGAVVASSLAGAPDADAYTSSNQFVAVGPAPYGFLTNSSSIDTGALLIGRTNGIRATGERGIGGRFQSGDLKAQINLAPQPGPAEPSVPAAPTEYAEPGRGLPAAAVTGDFYFTEADSRGSGTLWLCVAGAQNRIGTPAFEPAIWRQVLLGSPFPGRAVAID